MPLVPTLAISNSATGELEIYRDASDYAGYGGKSLYYGRRLLLVLADGSTLADLDFSFADYPSDIITVSVPRDYAPLATLSFNSIELPTVTTTAASSITTTGATSGGNITSAGGGTVSAKGVCWNTTGTPTISDSHTSDGTGIGSFTSALTSLTGATIYYIRAYATNEAGTTYGNELSFTSLALLLETYAVASYTGAKGSNGNLLYVLKITNNTANTYAVTGATIVYGGTFQSADTPGVGAVIYYNTVPLLSGGGLTNLLQYGIGNSPVTKNASISFSSANNSVVYLLFSINIDAGATTGHTFNIDGAINPITLTITGSPTQENSQTNIGATITIGT